MVNGKRIFFCVLLAAVCLSVAAYDDHRNARVDSLEAALQSANPPTGADLLKAYNELMRGYLPYDSGKAEYYAHKALSLSYGLNGLKVRQNVFRHLGLLSYSREEFDEALRYFNQALAVTDSMEHDRRYAEIDVDDARSSIYGSIANVYNLQGKAHLAIHYYQLALPIFEKYGWLESQAVLYHNIGELYLFMGNVGEAEHNYLMAAGKGEASGDSLMVAIARKGLTKIYLGQDDYGKALATAEQCYTYYYPHRDEEVEDYSGVLALMARVNLMAGHEDIAAAKAYAQEALALADNLYFENRSDVYAACAEVAVAEGRWQQALGYALQTVHPDSMATHSDVTCYQLLALIYIELGQKAKAREYIQKMYDVMTRYATDHYQSGLSQMEVLYETEKKEAQIAALDRERGLYSWLLAAAVVAIAALAAGTVLLVLVQRRKKALLAARVALETETKERRILARDLHDGLGGMLSLLKVKVCALFPDSSPVKEGREAVALLDKTIVELRRTAHHLLPEELLRNGLVSALHDYAVSVPGARFQTIGDIRLPKGMELVLYRCAYELVHNAMKHSGADRIDIQLMQGGREITLTVSDNGKGMAETPPEGMGLQNINERIEPYRGRLDIVSVPGKGTDINITLPL